MSNKSYWDKLTPEQRSKEIKRRQEVHNQKQSPSKPPQQNGLYIEQLVEAISQKENELHALKAKLVTKMDELGFAYKPVVDIEKEASNQ